jgi:organic hydroperoxide reductase OsmC/OhrA
MTATFLSHLDWSGAATGGTHGLATLNRDLNVTIDGLTVPMSAAPDFGGSSVRVNPEQMYVASLSACQALTFLFLAARAHLVVTGYSDDAIGELAMVDGKMRMASVTLRPRIAVAPGVNTDSVRTLVEKAHGQCFIGNSVSAKVSVEPVITCENHPASVQ